MGWKTDDRSFYHESAPESEGILLSKSETALLVMDDTAVCHLL